jgi:hypothetical protein
MPRTYEPIATTTLGSAQSSVTFSTISGTYTDLVLIAQARTDYASFNDDIQIFLNNDNSSLYSSTRLIGNGSTASSDRQTNQTSWFNISAMSTAASGVYPVLKMELLNYANTTTNKTALFRNNTAESAAGQTQAIVGLYRSTNAVTQITIRPRFGTVIASGSTFTLYGIKAA